MSVRASRFTRIFAEEFVLANNRANKKTLQYWPFVRLIHRLQRAGDAENVSMSWRHYWWCMAPGSHCWGYCPCRVVKSLHPCRVVKSLHPCRVVKSLHPCRVVKSLHPCRVVKSLHPCRVVKSLHPCRVVKSLHHCRVVKSLHPCRVVKSLHPCRVVKSLHPSWRSGFCLWWPIFKQVAAT